MAELMTIIQILILGYALGSIPFGVVLAKLFKLPDPRYIGSGNIGATNMLRTGNKKVALLTLVLDAGKGAVAVIITRYLFGALLIRECHWDAGCVPEELIINASYLALAILAAAIGHMYSPWLKFKGGKGVATLFGGALAFSWPVGIAGFLVWAIVMFVTRYVSLASIAALAIAPLIAWLRVDGTSALILAIACGIAIWKHRENIKRLRQGFEPKMGLGKGGEK
jgi:acyl phosphate:glycerol-3-phosphate acyltransferase